MSIILNDVDILNIHGVDYCFLINGLDKKEATNLLQNADLTEKTQIL